MEKILPPEPRVSEVNKYLKGWKKLEKYTSQERALNKLFLELLPGNSEITDHLNMMLSIKYQLFQNFH